MVTPVASPAAPAGAATPASPGTEPARGRRRISWRRARPVAVPLIAYIAVAMVVFAPAWRDPLHTIVGVPWDARQEMWFLTWIPWAISHGHNPLTTVWMNYPAGVNLMWNASAPLIAVVLWPVTALGGQVLAYNVLMTLDLALSAWAAYLAIGRFTSRRSAAFVGGLIYGFSPFELSHAIGHAKIAFGVLPPVMVILLHELWVRRTWSTRRAGLLIGAACAAQTLIFEESLLITVICAVAATIVAAALWRDAAAEAVRRTLRAAPWTALVYAVVCAFPLAVEFFGANRQTASIPGAEAFSARAVNLIVPSSTNLFAPGGVRAVQFFIDDAENAAYIGVPVMLLVLITVIALRRRRLIWWLALSTAAAGLLAAGPYLIGANTQLSIPLPWHWIGRLPLMGSILPGRFMQVADLGIATILAVGLDAVLARLPGRAALSRRVLLRPEPIALAALAALAALTLLPNEPFVHTEMSDSPSYFLHLPPATAAAPVVLVAPFVADGATDDALYWQAQSWMRFKMPGGYYVNVTDQPGVRLNGPKSTATSRLILATANGYHPTIDPPTRAAVAQDLQTWRVQRVVVAPMPYEDEMVSEFSDLLGRRPVHTGGVYVWDLDAGSVS